MSHALTQQYAAIQRPYRLWEHLFAPRTRLGNGHALSGNRQFSKWRTWSECRTVAQAALLKTTISSAGTELIKPSNFEDLPSGAQSGPVCFPIPETLECRSPRQEPVQAGLAG